MFQDIDTTPCGQSTDQPSNVYNNSISFCMLHSSASWDAMLCDRIEFSQPNICHCIKANVSIKTHYTSPVVNVASACFMCVTEPKTTKRNRNFRSCFRIVAMSAENGFVWTVERGLGAVTVMIFRLLLVGCWMIKWCDATFIELLKCRCFFGPQSGMNKPMNVAWLLFFLSLSLSLLTRVQCDLLSNTPAFIR